MGAYGQNQGGQSMGAYGQNQMGQAISGYGQSQGYGNPMMGGYHQNQMIPDSRRFLVGKINFFIVLSILIKLPGYLRWTCNGTSSLWGTYVRRAHVRTSYAW